MEKKDPISTINSLSAVVDSLNRAGEKEAIKKVVAKLMELIAKI